MLKVKYERYLNDNNTTYEEKEFLSLEALSDWLFSKAYGELKSSLSFIDPDMDYMVNGRLSFGHGAIRCYDGRYTIWIRLIEKDGKIIFSTGSFTNNICHWNDEVRAWLREMRNRREHPSYNFG